MKIRLAGVLVLALAAGCAPSTGYGTIVGEAPPAPMAPTPSPAPPAPHEVPTETHTGKGPGGFEVTWPKDQLGFFTFDCPKCESNVIISTDGGEFGLVNAIGSYKGTTWLNTYPDQPTTRITVVADGAWTATIADYRSVPTAEPGKETKGKGDAVLRVPAGTASVKFTARSKGNVALWVMTDEMRDLLVNEIGDQDRTVPVDGPAYLKVDDWEGTWTVTPS